MKKAITYCYLLAVLAVVHGQGQVPRLADGHPDLGSGGVWLPLAVPDMASSAAPKVDLPFQPWAKLKFQENEADKQSDPELRCLPPGVPRIALMARPFEIVQTSNRILFVYEGGAHVWRQVWMDGRAHPKNPNPIWMGYSIGNWEGDTLVVDSVGFNDKTWLDDVGHPHTEQLHVIEKYTRINPLTMKYDITIIDPGAYTHSWASSSSLSFRPGEKLKEDICLDKIESRHSEPRP
jgi:hypothetical protein